MKKIIYKTETGIAIIHPTNEGLLKFGGIEGIAKKDVPKGYEYKIVDESEIPSDRIFRDAWDYDLKEDIVKSKEIKKKMLRAERESLFIKNDLVLRDAILEANSTKKTAGLKERDRLRDITKLVDSAKTIKEIKAITV